MSNDFSSLERQDEVEKLLLAAAAALRRGKVQRARTKVKSALELIPDHPEALELLGEIYLTVGQFEAAEQLFRQVAFDLPDASPKIKALAETKLGETALQAVSLTPDQPAFRKALAGKKDDKPASNPSWRKSPSTAAALSLLLPGLGQLYVERRTKGVLFLGLAVFVFLALMMVAFSLVNDLQAELRNTSDVFAGLLLLYLNMWQGVGAVWLLLDLALRIYTAIDAVFSANAGPPDEAGLV